MFEAIKWRWVDLYNLDLCFITACWDQGAVSACQTEIMRGGSWGKMAAFSSVLLDQATIVDLHLRVCLLIIKKNNYCIFQWEMRHSKQSHCPEWDDRRSWDQRKHSSSRKRRKRSHSSGQESKHYKPSRISERYKTLNWVVQMFLTMSKVNAFSE